MKKIIAILLVLALTFCAAGCSKKTEEPSAGAVGMANPNKYGITYDELVQLTGLSFNTPEGAADVKYNAIMPESERPMAEMTFTMNGKSYTLRVQPTAVTSLYKQAAADADAKEVIAMLDNLDLDSINISGISAKWEGMGTAVVSDRDGVQLISKDAVVLCWADLVPGIMYNLSVSKDSKTEVQFEELISVAEAVFAPMQGDA